jgi:hypothetical protein
MTHQRRIDELASRVAATFVYYQRTHGRWEDCPPLAHELRTTVAGADALGQLGTRSRTGFFRVLEAELTARFGDPAGRRLVALVREVANPAGPSSVAL